MKNQVTVQPALWGRYFFVWDNLKNTGYSEKNPHGFGNLFKGSFPALSTSGLSYEASEPVSFMDTIDANERIIIGINDLNNVFMRVMEMILKLSPIGVFCLLCPVPEW